MNFTALALGCNDASDCESKRIFQHVLAEIRKICILLHRSKFKIYVFCIAVQNFDGCCGCLQKKSFLVLPPRGMRADLAEGPEEAADGGAVPT